MNDSSKSSSSFDPRYQYEICGLYLESDISFSLKQTRFTNMPDIMFRLKNSGETPEERYPDRALIGQIKNGAGYPSIAVYSIDQGFILDCHNTQRRVEFVTQHDAQWIDCYPHAGASVEDIELWLFGLVMSFILQSRGIFSLHAAAVNYGGKAIAFLGSNGYGKSTLALFFANNGHELITDDVLPIVEKQGRVWARPGSPSINLWRQTLDHLGSAHQVSSTRIGGKHRYALDDLKLAPCGFEVPLEQIYLLHPLSTGDSEAIRIEPAPRAQAMIDLLAYTRANSMIDVLAQQTLLRTYASLLSQASVHRLEYPIGFEHLPKIYRAVLQSSFGRRRNPRSRVRAQPVFQRQRGQ